MRNLLVVAALVLSAPLAGCESGPGAAKEPPVLTVTSPARSSILGQGQASQVTVSGTVAPNANGDAVDKVLVNNVQATLEPGGTFHALIDVGLGVTLIQTVARDINGTTASDTRAVQAGPLRPVGSNIASAVTAAMSADAFTKISAAAGPILQGLDMSALLAPMQPMVHLGDEDGEDCKFLQLFVDDLTFSDVAISLSPVGGGLAFRAEIDGLDVSGHARFKFACLPGSTSARITADKIVVSATLNVTPDGTSGFATRLVSPSVSVTGLHPSLSGIPEGLLELLNLDSAIEFIVEKGAELAMNPLLNQVLGALGGPQQLDVLGHQLDLQVAPSAISFSSDGALVAMDMKVLLAGSQSSPGFVFTDNGAPTMDPGHGFQLGLADDLANEMMAELQAIGMLDLTMPATNGPFDATQIHMTLPPTISADLADGQLRLVLGDVLATFTNHGVPVGRAAINARVDLKIASTGNGGSVALQLGTPDIHVDTLDDIDNATGLEAKDLATAVGISLGAQIDAISKLLVAIPIPAIAGLQMRDLSIGSDDGYVMVRGQLQ